MYTTEEITKMFKEEGGSLFDSRSASLGHTLQGGIPSPTDRTRAVRLSLKSMSFIEQHHQQLLKQQSRSKQAPPESAAIITIRSAEAEVRCGAVRGDSLFLFFYSRRRHHHHHHHHLIVLLCPLFKAIA